MKIKLLAQSFAGFEVGETYEAVVSYDGQNAVAFQPGTVSYFWFGAGQFETIKEEPEKRTMVDIQDILLLRDEGRFSAQEIVELKKGGVL